MTIGEFLQAATADFTKAGLESARLDALILLEDELGQDRALLLAHTEKPIPPAGLARLEQKKKRRAAHEPLAYIRGHAPFYGHEFAVNTHVLVPRPESEAMIDLLKKHAPRQKQPLRIADIGTGSGALGITAALALPDASVDLFDLSTGALRVARQNATRHHVRADCAVHDLLAGIYSPYTILLANLPYVPEQLPLNTAARYEPQDAIFSGPDGLDHYKRFWPQVHALAHKPALVITEALPFQHHANALLARAAGYYAAETLGLAQAFQPLE